MTNRTALHSADGSIKRTARKAIRSSGARRLGQRAVRAARVVREAGDSAARVVGKAGDSALRTAGDVTELVLDAAQNTLVFNPLLGIRRRDMAAAAGSLLRAVAASPQAAASHLGAYLRELPMVS